jgi:outer membrane lipoprotein-sorting protein
MGGDLNDTAILGQMAQVYADCKTYCDSGTSTTDFLGKNPFQEKLDFKTAFRRPQDFRFEYREKLGIAPGVDNRMITHMIIHRDRSGTCLWWSVTGKEDAESLGMAIAAATGVSSRTAHTVPNLLMAAEIGGRGFLQDRNWTLLPESEHDGHACFRVSHKTGHEDTETLLIDKTSLLLLRIEEAKTIEGKRGRFKTERTTTYVPQFDVDIPEADLVFDAPEGK